MSEQPGAVAAILIGAVVGSAVGFLFFSEPGRRFCRQIDPALDDLGRELKSLRGTVYKAVNVANEGWQLLSEAFGEAPPPPDVHQVSPF